MHLARELLHQRGHVEDVGHDALRDVQETALILCVGEESRGHILTQLLQSSKDCTEDVNFFSQILPAAAAV